jgi:hypothetical protein
MTSNVGKVPNFGSNAPIPQENNSRPLPSLPKIKILQNINSPPPAKNPTQIRKLPPIPQSNVYGRKTAVVPLPPAENLSGKSLVTKKALLQTQYNETLKHMKDTPDAQKKHLEKVFSEAMNKAEIASGKAERARKVQTALLAVSVFSVLSSGAGLAIAVLAGLTILPIGGPIALAALGVPLAIGAGALALLYASGRYGQRKQEDANEILQNLSERINAIGSGKEKMEEHPRVDIDPRAKQLARFESSFLLIGPNWRGYEK